MFIQRQNKISSLLSHRIQGLWLLWSLCLIGNMCLAAPAGTAAPVTANPAHPLPDTRLAPLIKEAESLLEHGHAEDVLPKLTSILEQARAIGDKVGEATALNDLGGYYGLLGQRDKELDFYQQALVLAQQIGDKYDEAGIQTSIGLFYANTGQPQKALQILRLALELTRQVGDHDSEARAIGSLGVVYANLNQLQQALTFFLQDWKMQKAADNQLGQLHALNNLGLTYRKAGDLEQAMRYFEQALPLCRATGDRLHEAKTLQNMALIYADTRQSDKALELFQQALPIARSIQNKRAEAEILSNIGAVALMTGKAEVGLEALNQALPTRKAVQDIPGIISTLTNIAVAEEVLHRFPEAREHIRAAIDIVEQQRTVIGDMKEAKISYLESNLQPYAMYIDLLLVDKQGREAFAWTQKIKARSLVDLMQRGKVDLGKGMTDAERQQELRLGQQLTQTHKQFLAQSVAVPPNLNQLSLLERQLAQAQSKLQQFHDTLYAKYPDLASQQVARTVVPDDLTSFLPADAALLEYVVLHLYPDEARCPTVLFCATVENGQAVIKSYMLAGDSTRLMASAEEFRAACSVPIGEYQTSGQSLYAQLIAPAAMQLAGKKHLVICPDGGLWGLPFQALVKSGGPDGNAVDKPIGDRNANPVVFLSDEYEISYAYSATALQAAQLKAEKIVRLAAYQSQPATPGAPAAVTSREPNPQAEMLIVANPQFSAGIAALPGTQVEGAAIQSLFPNAVLYSGDKAQEDTIKAKVGRFRYLHFATHGSFNNEFPMLSSVVLAKPTKGSSEDGFLTAQEIFDLSLRAELVVLSACETAQGEKHGGEGVVGLSWSLFVAGAPTQVLSQWPVNDQSTASMMKTFYANLKVGKSKAAALQSAMQNVRKNPAYSHPGYWAPFVLIGEWK